jgi:hypothetical protein
MERFALALISSDYRLQCCGRDMGLQPFQRIVIDPKINHLWTTGYVRHNHAPGPDDEFILLLHQYRVFSNAFIVSQIELLTGWELTRKQANRKDSVSSLSVQKGLDEDTSDSEESRHDPLRFRIGNSKASGKSAPWSAIESDRVAQRDGNPGGDIVRGQGMSSRAIHRWLKSVEKRKPR